MDSINIKNLTIFANHGFFQAEKELGQKFQIDIKLNLDTQETAYSKNLDKSVHYGLLIEQIKEIFTNESIDLIETLAEETASFILYNYSQVYSVELRIKKPWAPVMSQVDNIWVEIKRKRNRVFLGLGSNMGDTEALVKEAVESLNSPHTKVIRESSVYRTKAWGKKDQDDFSNMVIEIQTSLTPHNLLKFTQSIENKMGRIRKEKWGPRVIDIDILFYEDKVIYTDDLMIPHPYIEERAFVLEPMEEIAPYYIHPVSKKQIRILKNKLENK